MKTKKDPVPKEVRDAWAKEEQESPNKSEGKNTTTFWRPSVCSSMRNPRKQVQTGSDTNAELNSKEDNKQ